MDIASPAIVSLSCGCFFQGRDLLVDAGCEEHSEEKSEFSFDELDDRAKERAREWFRRDYPDYGWWEFIFDDVNQIAELMGIRIHHESIRRMDGGFNSRPAIYFSGFHSQGDGACFKGEWSPVSQPIQSLTHVMEHAPDDEDLHDIAFELALLSERCTALIPEASVRVENAYSGSHSGCTSFDINLPPPGQIDEGHELLALVWEGVCRAAGLDFETFEDSIKTILRAFMDWIYSQLEKEHDYLTSDEQVDESIRANAYTFDTDGRPA